MTIIPKVGLVVKYDFLWKHEAATGQEHGSKDRPSAIIIVSDENEDGSCKVVLCAITHTPPFQNEKAVAVPAKVSDHLGFDGLKSWIKTDQVNTVCQGQSKTLPLGRRKTSPLWFDCRFKIEPLNAILLPITGGIELGSIAV